MTPEEVLKQIHKRPPPGARKYFNHFSISKPNELHQIDLMELPLDGDKKYVLCVVDCASRYKAARALVTKEAAEVTFAIISIYTDDKYLDVPLKINSDDGNEWKGAFGTWCKKNKVIQIKNEKSYHCAFVENFNKELAKKLFKHQDLEELRSSKANTVWVKHLQKTVIKMNNTITMMIKMKPIDAVQLLHVVQPVNNFTSKQLKLEYPIGTVVRRLLNPDEVLNLLTKKIVAGKKRRATDPSYSIDVYSVVQLSKGINALVLHQIKNLSNGKLFKHWQTFYELQKIRQGGKIENR